MNKKLLAGLAILLFAGGVLSIATAVAISVRSAGNADAGGTNVDLSYLEPPETTEEWLTKYTLTERSGRKFNSQELDGQVSVVSFFFSNCPAACRLQNLKIKELVEEFGGRGVKFAGITCDPASDSPARLREYAKMFDAPPDSWLFLTGNMKYISRIGGEVYGVHVDKGVHLERLVVVDRWGEIRNSFHWNDPEKVTEMRQMLNQLLAETSPPPADKSDE
jgi:protein SCO1/2